MKPWLISERKCTGRLRNIFKQKIDILLVSETKIDDTVPLAQFSVEGYSTPYTAQKMKFSIKDSFSKCDQIHSFTP